MTGTRRERERKTGKIIGGRGEEYVRSQQGMSARLCTPRLGHGQTLLVSITLLLSRVGCCRLPSKGFVK